MSDPDYRLVLDPDDSRTHRERLLSTALARIVVAAGGVIPDVPLTGPQLLAAADDLAGELERRQQLVTDLGGSVRILANEVAHLQDESAELRQILKTAWLMVRVDAYDAPGRISNAIRPFLEAKVASRPWGASPGPTVPVRVAPPR